MKKEKEMERNHYATIVTVNGIPVIHVGSFMGNLQTGRKGRKGRSCSPGYYF